MATATTASVASIFRVNYFYELPDELQSLIYRKLFKDSLSVIDEMREPLDNYERLIAYVKVNNKKNNMNNEYKNRAIWNIFLCERRDIGDPYYKYFQYFADDGGDYVDDTGDATNVLRLNKTKMIRNDNRYSTIRYIDYSIYPLNIRVSDESYTSMKKVIDDYAVIFLRYDADNENEYPYIRRLYLLNDKIRIEYKDEYVFRNTIDIYNNILDAYNFITKIFDILFMYNHLYPAYDLEYMNDIIDLRNWFEYNTYFHGYSIADTGDILRPRFYS
uniref:Uncharacterized protein n=1 Tax=viral metagenome TaxID=1070528 RepID=A0A6C0LL01_9ZZZZ